MNALHKLSNNLERCDMAGDNAADNVTTGGLIFTLQSTPPPNTATLGTGEKLVVSEKLALLGFTWRY